MQYHIRFILWLACLLYSWTSYAQWNSFIINFKKDLFGRGAQTWQIQAYDDNHLFAGNKNGVLHYNGDNWACYPFRNGLDVRSVYLSEQKKRIYAGGENEFGYLEPGHTGKLVYVPLSDMFNEQYGLYGGYWGVYEVDNLMYYVSDRHVVKQVEDMFVAIESGFKIDCSAIVNGVLHVGTVNGIWMLVGNTWLPASQNEFFHNKTIRAIEPYKDGYLAATAFDGLFFVNRDGISSLITGMEDFMNRNEIFSLAVFNELIAVGTIHKGLLLIDLADGQVRYYNGRNGLQNNTVLSVCFDKRGDLWLGLDNGIDYISLHNSLTSLYTAPYSKGAGYDALIHGEALYLGTNRGLFFTEWPVETGENAVEPRLIPELSGQVWGLKEMGEEVFCLHDKGLFLIRKDGVEEIPGLRGALVCHPFESDPFKCWIGSYNGLFLLEKKKGRWEVLRQVGGITNWMKNVLFENAFVLWVRDTDVSMTRIELNSSLDAPGNSLRFDESNGFADAGGLRAHKVFGEVRFSTLSGIYRYNKENGTVEPDDFLTGCLLPGKEYTQLVTVGQTLFALSVDMIQVVRFAGGKAGESYRFLFNPAQIDFIKSYEALIPLSENQAIIPNEFGFTLLDTELAASHAQKELFIEHVYLSYPKDSLIYTDNIAERMVHPRISYGTNALRFEYGIRSFGQSWPVEYRYRLLPDTLWSVPASSTVKEYGNLREGEYLFEVAACFPGEEWQTQAYAFTICPPWYRSAYARIIYLFFSILLIYVLYKLEDRRIARKRKIALAEKEKEMLLKEQEYAEERLLKEGEIVKLQKEKLEQELSHKSQEIANLMINFTRKNEILMDIKKELNRITAEIKGEHASKAKRMLLTLNNSIDSNIASDDALKRFEDQFDLIHNNYMKRVREKHTNLTTSEIKMCAYVKMGLSSKEIAPLLNISVRGVETLRYRLRKKMNIGREASLTDYLNTFS